MGAPFGEHPSRIVNSADGTPIAVFSAGDGPALVLVHGTSADHRTWRVVGPLLAPRYTLHAIDRRGRGASGDGPTGAYAIEHELEDIAAVTDAIAGDAGGAVDVVGHSLGGRIALGASLRTRSIGRIVAYESAPTEPRLAPGGREASGVRTAPGGREASGVRTAPGGREANGERDALLEALTADLERGDHDALLARFMTVAVGMSAADLAAFRADPIWPLRAAAAPTIVRELEAADRAPEIGLEALAEVTVPVLQLVGSDTAAAFRDGAARLDRRLARGRLEVIDGARHAAHHTHPDDFVARVDAFLGR